MAMWVWDVQHLKGAERRDELLAFCRTQRIATLYLAAYQLTPELTAAYRTFNRAAHAQGVTVHALAGDPRWALNRYHHLPLAWMDAVTTFNVESQPEERFDGLHTDIEPYLLSRMWQEHPARLLGGWLDLHATLAQRRPSEGSLALGADVPFWFDDDPAYRIQWRDRVLPPSHHALEVADYITVMAYRNYAQGTEGVIQLAQKEVAYAEQAGKTVIVGQETQPDLFPADITYGGKGRDYWWGEVAKVTTAFRGRKSFGGVAVHHYDSYRKLVG